MAPKIDWPARSNISMRTWSPNFMNGVAGLPGAVGSRPPPSAVAEEPGGASRVGARAGTRVVPPPPPLGDARAAGRRIAVGDRAGTDDRPRLQGACLGGMGDQLAEIEGQVGGGVGMAELLAVQGRDQRQVELAAVPGIAQLV